MADLSDINAAQTVKIVGNDATGVEQTPVQSLSDGSLKTNVANGSGASAVNIQDGGNSITIDATSLPLPTGASTSALQTTLNTAVGSQGDAAATTDTGSFSIIAFIKRGLQNWTTLLSRVATLGQKTMSGSQPVAIASDQSAIPATQSGTWNINNITGTVSLPTGAATSANQTNGTQLSRITDGTTQVGVTTSGNLRTADILNLGTGTQAALTVGTTAVEVKVGGSPLTNRKLATLYNSSNSTLYWGFSSGVTTATGTPIYKDQQVSWSVGPSQSIFVIAGSAGNNTRITEA